MRLQIVGVALAIGLTFSATTQAGNISGSMLANPCGGCHGANGASTAGTMPTIGGMSKTFLVTAMKQYRDGSRGSTVMGRVAKGYDDAQLTVMSEHLAKQKWVSAPQKADAKLVKQGAAYHEKVCGICHSENANGAEEDGPPRLAGQWTPYLRLYLNDMSSPDAATNTASMHPKKKLFEKATPSDIDALLQFYASQK